MAGARLKYFIVLAVVAAAGAAIFFAKRRVPVCEADGKYMAATASDCQSWGYPEGVCKEAIETARAAVVRVAPKSETSFQCEVRFADCFQNAAGGFSPQPSFCLRAETGAEPKEIRYLEYESDRRNRKKTKEVRVD